MVFGFWLYICITKNQKPYPLYRYFIMEILARAVGRRKEAVAQIQLISGTGKFVINTKSAHEYLQNDSCSILDVQAPFEIFKKSGLNNNVAMPEHNQNKPKDAFANFAKKAEPSTATFNQENTVLPAEFGLAAVGGPLQNNTLKNIDTIVTVKGGGLKGQAEAIRLGIARALCLLDTKYAISENISQKDGFVAVGETAMAPQQAVLTLSNAPTAQNGQNVGLRKLLKDKGYLTQDSRVKERRKYGLKKARKASQYHKR